MKETGDSGDLLRIYEYIDTAGLDRGKYLEILASILDMESVGIAIADSAGTYRVFSRGAEKITGRKSGEVIGSKVGEIFFDGPGKEAIKRALTVGAAIEDLETGLRHRDGTLRDVILKMYPRPGSSGGICCFFLVFTDNFEKKHLQELVMQSQRMEIIGRMAGGIAHDFNNLLEGVVGYASFVLDLIDNSHEIRSYIEIIEESARKASELTARLLSLSSGEQRENQPVNCNSVLLNVIKFIEKSIDRGVVLETNLSKSLWTVRGAEGRLEEAFLNICLNAREAMPGGGRLHVSSENVTIDDSYPRLSLRMKKGKYVRISITDTGIGLDEERKKRIFDPFFTTKESGGGTGLGLSVVYGIVDSHGGFINVYSEVGKGTTFNVYLPASEEKAVSSLPEFDGAEVHEGRGELVLVVDDEPMILELTGKMLEKTGYRVLTAGDAEVAMQQFRSRIEDIAVVLLDVIMPHSDGPSLLGEMRRLRPGIPAILSSGYDESIVSKKAPPGTSTGFIQKPYSMRELAARIHRILHGGDTRA